MRYALLKCSWLSCHDDQKAVVEMYSYNVANYILRTVPPGDEFTIQEARIVNAPCLMHLQKSTRSKYISLILNNHIAAFPHDSGAIIKTNRKRGAGYLWRAQPHEISARKENEISPAEAEEALGRVPAHWEMDRINCTKAGTVGHYSCGWCTFHRQPILICGCRNREV